MSGKKDALQMDVLKKFRLIFGAVRQHYREVEETCGISGSQLWLLQEISSMPGIGVSDLAAKLSIHQSTCSQLVEKLVARELVSKERSQSDQRRVGLVARPEAKAVLANAPGPATGLLPDALMALSAVNLKDLDGSLQKLIEQLQRLDQSHAEKLLADM